MDNGFPATLIKSADRLVRIMLPAMKSKSVDMPKGLFAEQHVEDEAKVFPNRAPPDQAARENSADDVFGMMESLAPKYSQHKQHNSDVDKSLNRARTCSRIPKRSWPRGRERHTSERYDGDDDEKRNMRRYQQERGDNFDRQENEIYRNCQPIDDFPVLHKIYDGHVTGVKEFGVFVNLHGVKGIIDG
ncbi:hypothetical protein N7456_012019 [Penicillium angulare]|uniref:S1 motif domain-containing protein n=1 Tax=Penicillium angulare TaxID=116970 RepID=A0A9W9EUW3_9EURO|nr:hypothetical protein N7456_012019 [Penicillium angulare]